MKKKPITTNPVTEMNFCWSSSSTRGSSCGRPTATFFYTFFFIKKNLTFFFSIEKKSCIFLFHKKNSTFFLFIEKMLQFIFLSRRDGEALVEGLGGLVGHKHKVLDAVALAAAVVRGLALQACYVLQHLVQSFHLFKKL